MQFLKDVIWTAVRKTQLEGFVTNGCHAGWAQDIPLSHNIVISVTNLKQEILWNC